MLLLELSICDMTHDIIRGLSQNHAAFRQMLTRPERGKIMKYVGRHRRVTDPSYHLVQGRPACNIHRFEFVCFDFYLPVFVVLFLPKSIY
jgi:hypothetical protein